MRDTWRLLVAVCSLVIGVYVYMDQSGAWELWSQNAADTNYNLLVEGFRARQLSLKKEVPPGFARLADPYDPSKNLLYRGSPYRLNDLSYYKGRLYLYFGVTPALVLFWPYVAVTGQYLFHRQAVMIFCTVGFLASVGLMRALWRRYFPEVSAWVVAACAFALGLATGLPEQLSQADFYEVAQSCGYMLVMLALWAIWQAFHETGRKKCGWLATASVAYGLAVGARASLLLGAVILLLPVLQAWRERRPRVWVLLLAGTGPILFIGLGLMLYNAHRFDSPFEFGARYQLNWFRPGTRQMFSLRYLWLNFRVYFLEPVRWSAPFPFVHEIAITRVPQGHAPTGRAFGVLMNIPFAWLALAAPLAWRSQAGPATLILRSFVTAVAVFFGICSLTLGLCAAASYRYEVDFLPALLLLAVIGIFGLESALINRPVQLSAARWAWGLLLAFSVAFNLLASVEHYAEVHNIQGLDLVHEGQMQAGIEQYEQALRIEPYYAPAHYDLGIALAQVGRLPEAIIQYEQALQINPDQPEAHSDLGVVLQRTGKVKEAVEHYEQALRLNPNYADAHHNLGVALVRLGHTTDAIAQFEQALQINPDDAMAHYNLGVLLQRAGSLEQAVGQYEKALQSKPDYEEAHHYLGVTLARLGHTPEAIAQFEQALRINPDDAEAQYDWGVLLQGAGKLEQAVEHYEQALRPKPDYAEAHHNLGVTLARLGRVPEAIAQFEQALRINPDDAKTRNALAQLQAQGTQN